MVGKGGRDEADDTGGLDVSELRARFSAGQQLPVAEEPDITDDEIEAVLLQMVDEGELSWGWLPERQEFGFWTNDTSVSPCAPGNDARTPTYAEPVVEATGPKHRQPKAPVMRRVAVTVAAVLATPLVGVAVAEVANIPVHRALDDSTDASDASYVSIMPTTPTPTSEPTKRRSHVVTTRDASSVDATPTSTVTPTVREDLAPHHTGHADQQKHHSRAEEKKKSSKGKHRRTKDRPARDNQSETPRHEDAEDTYCGTNGTFSKPSGASPTDHLHHDASQGEPTAQAFPAAFDR